MDSKSCLLWPESWDIPQQVFKSLLSTEPWRHDPYILPIPWRAEKEYEVERESGYRPAFGFMLDDGVVTPHPPISRALRIVKQAMRDFGYQVCKKCQCAQIK